jgi:hypothetical protein
MITPLLLPIKRDSESFPASIEDDRWRLRMLEQLCAAPPSAAAPGVVADADLQDIWTAFELMYEGRQPEEGVATAQPWVDAFAELGFSPYDPDAEEEESGRQLAGGAAVVATGAALLIAAVVASRRSAGPAPEPVVQDDDDDADDELDPLGRAGPT